jgi:hypothetical protein
MTQYELWIDDPQGVTVGIVNGFTRVSVTLVANGVGHYKIDFPLRDLDLALFQKDRRLRLYRDDGSGKQLVGYTSFMLRAWSFSYTPHGRTASILAYHPLFILSNPSLTAGRIVAYAAESAQAAITAKAADDAMKDIIRQNAGSSATAARDLSAYLSVASNRTEAGTITKAFSRQNVLAVLQDIYAESAKAGTPVYFDIRTASDGKYIFDTYLNQLGANQDKLTTFSPKFGNVSAAQLSYDHTDEVTTAYVGGYGVEANRDVATSTDAAREGETIWSRRETFTSFYDRKNDNLTSVANSVVYAGRPVVACSVTINNTEYSSLGVHYNFGSKARVDIFGVSFVGEINVMTIDFANRKESIGVTVVKNV